MTISKVEIENFRIYQGINVVEFTPKPNKNISLVCGNNGYGKTTFLISLVWCLYGKDMELVDEIYKKEISNDRNYSKYIHNSLNKISYQNGKTKFSVGITFTNLDTSWSFKEIKIVRTYNIEEAGSEIVMIYFDGQENELTSQGEEQSFIESFILPKEIAKFFFFDAEKVVSMAIDINSIDSKSKFSEAYTEVLGIKKYVTLKENLNLLLSREKVKQAGPKEKKEFATIEETIKKIDIDLDEERTSLINDTGKLDELYFDEKQNTDLLAKYGKLISEDELKDLRDKLHQVSEKLTNYDENIKIDYEFMPFVIMAPILYDVESQLKAELDYNTTKILQDQNQNKVDDILNRLENIEWPEDFVIDRRTKEFMMRNIDILLKEVFNDNLLKFDSNFKMIHNLNNIELNKFQYILSKLNDSFINSFKDRSKSYHEAKQEKNTLNRKLKEWETNSSDPAHEAIRSKLIDIREDINSTIVEIANRKNRISQLEDDKTKYKRKFNELKDKIEISESKIYKFKEIEKYLLILNTFIKDYKLLKKASLEKRILKWLNKLFHKSDFISKVEVDISTKDEIDIFLFDLHYKKINPQQLSMGERQLYATALLISLKEESEINFPVFIDSPLQKLDKLHSENILRYFYPEVSDQVVLSPLLETELREQQYELIKQRVNCCYLIKNISSFASSLITCYPDELFQSYQSLNKISKSSNELVAKNL